MPTDTALPIAEPWCVTHPLTPEDASAMAAMRAVVAPNKGKMQGPAARNAFNEIMMRVAPPQGVTFHPDTVGSVPGW